MSDSTSKAKPTAEARAEHIGRDVLSAIDQSVRGPAVIFGVASVIWLLVATLFGLIASFKLHSPGFLGNWEWLTYGRVRPAFTTALIYGWASCAGLGVTFWLMARLSRQTVRNSSVLITAAVFWNIGVLAGVVGILAGHSTGREWFEMPGYTAPLLFVSYVLIAVWAVLVFRFRQSQHAYVSEWYLLGALFWFPALYGIAFLMLVVAPVRGVLQPVVGWWFAYNLYALWLTPIGLAAVYYFIPKLVGRPVHSYYFAGIAFWTYLLFASWAGTHYLAGGPVPAWIASVGIAGCILVLFPVVIIAINHHMTLKGHFSVLRHSPSLRFLYFGAANFTLVSVVSAITALRSVKETLHFTHFIDAQMQWGLYAWFAMAMFGAFYYIMPRVLVREWPSATLIKVHFWACASGIVLYILAMGVGGWIQGAQMNDPAGYPEFVEVVRNTVPWLAVASLAGVLLLVGHAAFAIHFFWMLVRPEAAAERRRALFKEPQPMTLSAK